MEKIYSDVVVIGGGPGGSICSVTAKMTYPDKEVTNIREFEHQMVPCAIPYTFSDVLGGVEKNIISCAMADEIGMKTIVGRVNKVDVANKTIYMDNKEITFDKLVFATGSTPFVHSSLQESLKLKGVFTIDKNVEKIQKAIDYTQDKQKVVVVGTGFIGVEMATELKEAGKDVTLVSGAKHILKGSFDDDIAMVAEEELQNLGINFIGEDRVAKVYDANGDGVVNGVELKSGKKLDAEVVILATGYRANANLAKENGLEFGHYGGIKVNEYMRTNNPDVFAVGDCAMKRSFISKEESKTMLASTASAEGRVAGMNLYGVNNLKNFSGTIAIFSTKIGSIALGSAGIIEAVAKGANANVVSATFEGVNRHPAAMPGSQKQIVKMVAMRNTGQIIGAQIVGGDEVGEMINMLGMMIENKMSVYDAAILQVATQPSLTAAPPAYPVPMVANMIIGKIAQGV